MGRRKKKKRKLRSASAKATAGAKAKAESKEHTPPPEASSAQGLGEDALTQPESEPKRQAPKLTNPIDRYFFTPVAPVRPYLLLRLTLVLLAFDCWIDLIPHAGRYGVGGFNVAHFGILDVLLPTPTPALYIGVMLMTGWVAMVMAIRPMKVGLAVLFGLYTYGWSMSMLDSYQHHYLLSLLLFSFIFFPIPAATDLFGPVGEDREPELGHWRIAGGALLLFFLAEATMAAAGVDTPLTHGIDSLGLRNGVRATAILLAALLILVVDDSPAPRDKKSSAWGYVSICVTCAIVYFYTAVTKLEPDWRQGHALRRLGTSDAFQELQALALGDGLPVLGPMTAEDFWALMAAGAIGVQLVSCVGYLLAAKQDRFQGWRRYLVAAFGLAPLSFHLGAERMELEIGWFSYYMLLILFVVFLPVELLRPIGAAFSWPARLFLGRLGERTGTDRVAWALLALGTAFTAGLTLNLDLPGDAAAGFGMGALLVGGAIWSMRRGRYAVARGWGVGAILSALLMWMAVTETDVRYDYYRFVGGDHRRRGEVEEALEAYVKANRHLVHPWCVQKGRERGDCFRDESRAHERATSLGDGWTVVTNDRREKEAQMRALLERQQEMPSDDE